jgi:hypothetical protein
MQKKLGHLIMVAIISLLPACGSDQQQTASSTDALALAMLANPDLATQLMPTFHLDPLDNTPSPVPTKAAATKPWVPEGPLTVSVADLQTSFEIKFCQLNSQKQVTLQSPQCQANIDFIKQQSGTGYFDLTRKPILNNPLGVTGVLFQTLQYPTQVTLPQGPRSFNVSGGLMLPQGISGSQIKGVVVYFHGTTFDKSVVGSNYSTNGETRLNAQVFASQGYIVLLPDYVGQGKDQQSVHPYVLYPQVSAKTAVDMLASAAPLIKSQYNLSDSSILKLFSAGYSEGGAYSLWFNTYLRQNPGTLHNLYQLTHSVGMEGAYSTSKVTKGFLFDDVTLGGGNRYNIQSQVVTNLVKPLLSADAFLSYATYQLNGDMLAVFNPDFYNLKCLVLAPSFCSANGSPTTIDRAFVDVQNVASLILSSSLKQSSNGHTYPADLALAIKNSVYALVSTSFVSSAAQAQLDAALRAADVDLSQVPDNSVSIISLSHDSVVTPNNYTALLAAYPSKIRYSYLLPESRLQVVSPFSYVTGKTPVYVNVDHMQALVYEFLYALNIFNQY